MKNDCDAPYDVHATFVTCPYCRIKKIEAENEALLEENIQLASWQCRYLDGKEGIVCDDWGNQYCNKDRQLQALRGEVMFQLTSYRSDGWIDCLALDILLEQNK